MNTKIHISLDEIKTSPVIENLLIRKAEDL
jgi:hypothetical protein